MTSNRHPALSLFEPDPFGKPVPTFPDHASEFFAAPALLPAPPVLSSPPIRYRTRIWLRDRKVLPAGPASSAACITFARPSAKSNSADVKTLTIGKTVDSPGFPPLSRTKPPIFRIPPA